MKYTVAFSKIKEPQLRRMLLGDSSRDDEPITGVAFVPLWAWNAVREIAKRDRMNIGKVLARAVRHYVVSEGFNKPTYETQDGKKPKCHIGFFDQIGRFAIRKSKT